MLDRVDQASTYLDQLVDALLELARAGRTRDERGTVHLDLVLDKVVARLAAAHPRVTVERGTRLPTIEANALAMEQVLDNLLSNAAKHGGRDDVTITVTHAEHDHGVRLVVADDGRGVAPEDREHVFVPFHRGRGAVATGSGIGLGLVRRVIEAHGGTIRLEDAAVGARFVIDLPTTDGTS
jgi:signal transduction histidine kinase